MFASFAHGFAKDSFRRLGLLGVARLLDLQQQGEIKQKQKNLRTNTFMTEGWFEAQQKRYRIRRRVRCTRRGGMRQRNENMMHNYRGWGATQKCVFKVEVNNHS